MSRNEVETAELQKLVSMYQSAAMAHGLATEAGDHATANRSYDTIAFVCRELRRRGRDAQLELLGLLNERDPYVRMWAATHALEFAPEAGVNILKELTTSEGIVGFDAQMTLKAWREGRLRFP